MKLLACCFFFCSIYNCYAQHEQTASLEKIQAAISQYIEQEGFSGSMLVADQGEVLYHKAFGLADRKAEREITLSTRFSIASVTKTLTAIRILQLLEDQQINLDESIITYLPSWSKQIPKKVTIHHLLLHTSGLPNEDDKVYARVLSTTEIIEKSLQNKARGRFGKFNYNNIDYLLLGQLIEKITTNRWEDEIRTHILQPCKMAETGFLAYGQYPADFAYTYTYNENEQPVADLLFYVENFGAAGNMYSTALDLLKLDQALYGNELLAEESKKLLAISNPKLGYVGYSVWNYRYPFVESQPLIMERRGGILGANVVLVRLTELHQTIIILSNDDRFNPDSFGDPDNLREMLIKALF